jgi:hypothetical protein
MPDLFRKYRDSKCRISPCFPEAGISPRQKRKLVFDFVAIKAESSDLAGERVRLAGFNGGRPFDPIKRWYRCNQRSKSLGATEQVPCIAHGGMILC